MNENFTIQVENSFIFKQKALEWASGFDVFCFLCNNSDKQNGFKTLLAVDALRSYPNSDLTKTKLVKNNILNNAYLFGHFGYDYKNEIENLVSENPDGVNFADVHLFEPRYLLAFEGEFVTVILNHSDVSAADLLAQIAQQNTPAAYAPTTQNRISLTPRIAREDYLRTVRDLQAHIVAGDVYEVNFCQEFFAENAVINPLAVFLRLLQKTNSPFSTFYRCHDKYLMCSSPERFLRKNGATLTSEPIKGTARRGSTPEADAVIRDTLYNSEKDRAENVMIVDLVRNDLARTCVAGSVEVKELFGIYSFAQVHQMISTIRGTLRPDRSALDALHAAFPAGSMTGAPKIMAMQLIERYERTRRGVYSGSVGYFTPDDDFDFNVVIRSFLYNAATQYLSAQVGGAIVYDSVAEAEYDECMLKLQGLIATLEP